MNRTPITEPHSDRVYTVSRPHDPAEQQADAAADVVARGGSVAGWSFLRVPPATVHRDSHDSGGVPSPDPDHSAEYAEAGETALKALAQTETAQRLIERIRSEPDVRRIEDVLTSDPALVGYGIAGAGAVAAGIAAIAMRGGAPRAPGTGFTLPFQMPDVPLDFITPGLSGRIAWEGPVDAPTNAGLVLTFTSPAGGGGGGQSGTAEETARLARELQQFRRSLRTPEEIRREEEWMARYLAERTLRSDSSTLLIPFGRTRPRVVPPGRLQLRPPTLSPPERRGPSLLPESELRLRPPAIPRSATDSTDLGHSGTADVARGISGPGRPIPDAVLVPMEARFGHDFRRVRLHDDVAGTSTARNLHARAFTVGERIGLDPHAAPLGSDRGGRTLAHELAHVVQSGVAEEKRTSERSDHTEGGHLPWSYGDTALTSGRPFGGDTATAMARPARPLPPRATDGLEESTG